jgi:hypothetical protein
MTNEKYLDRAAWVIIGLSIGYVGAHLIIAII